MTYKNKLLLILVLTVAMFAAACGTVPIGRILHDPTRYNNRNVTVQGTVTAAVGALGTGGYQVEDGTGKITVLSTGSGVPGKGARVKVNGTVSSGVTVMNRNFGTTIREHSHKVKY